MIESKEKLELNLPKETYIYTTTGSGKSVDFKIEPLPDDVMEMFQNLYDLGATIRTFPWKGMPGSDKPTSIFIDYEQDYDKKVYNQKIVGVNLKLHLCLLGNYPKQRMERLQKYYKDLVNINDKLPEQRVKYVKSLVVENTYEY